MVNRYKPKDENVKKLFAFLKKEEKKETTTNNNKKVI